jgi:hypothetical protein
VTSHEIKMTPEEMLEHDRGVERRMLWKGLLSLTLIAVVILVRQRYLAF